MEKIAIDQLKNYLGTGLLVQVGTTPRNLTALQDNCKYAFVTAWKGSREKQMVGIENVKPICYRLSDLDKEIEHDGERFVPIVELLNVAIQQVWGMKGAKAVGSPKVYSEGDSTGVIIVDEGYGQRIGFTADFSSLQKDFQLSIDGSTLVLNKLVLFNKLFEWHFWPFDQGYFEKGSVINKMKYQNDRT